MERRTFWFGLVWCGAVHWNSCVYCVEKLYGSFNRRLIAPTTPLYKRRDTLTLPRSAWASIEPSRWRSRAIHRRFCALINVHLSPYKLPQKNLPPRTVKNRRPTGYRRWTKSCIWLEFWVHFICQLHVPNPSQILTPHLTQVGLFKERERVRPAGL